VQARVSGVQAGRYHWSRIRYVDEGDVEHELHIGDWLMDVRAGDSGSWQEDSVTLGATTFGLIEVALHNMTQQPLTVHGLDAGLAGLPLASEMFLIAPPRPWTGGETIDPSGPPAAMSSGTLADAVSVSPQGTVGLRFTVAPPIPSPTELSFVELQPFVRCAAADGPERHWAMSPQVSAMPFGSEAELRQFVPALPSDALTELP
jgi:hypothetical protein